MANKQGTNQIIDSYIGDKLIEARYIGQTKYFDAYTELTGSLPLAFNSRALWPLKDYRVYGDADGSGVETENEISLDQFLQDMQPNTSLASASDYVEYTLSPNTTYTLSSNYYAYGKGASWFLTLPNTAPSSSTNGITNNNHFQTVTTGNDGKLWVWGRVIESSTAMPPITEMGDEYYIMLTEGSTPPATYIPSGYKIPLSISDGTNTSNYDLFVGDSKLGATEYLDFSEQKIYKDVSGTLTPTDPPAPLPAIQAYKGENTLSSTETVGEVSVKGRISAPPSVWTDLQWSIYPSISFAALSEAVHLKPGYYYVWQNVIGSSDFGVMVLQPDDFSGGIFGNKGIYHIETEGNYAIQINKNDQSKTYSSAELEALSSGSGIKVSEHTGCTWSVDPNAQYIAFSTMVTLEAGSYLLWQEVISASDFSVIVLQSEGQSTITPNANGICTVSNPGKYWMQINKNNVSKAYTSAELEALSYGSGLVEV